MEVNFPHVSLVLKHLHNLPHEPKLTPLRFLVSSTALLEWRGLRAVGVCLPGAPRMQIELALRAKPFVPGTERTFTALEGGAIAESCKYNAIVSQNMICLSFYALKKQVK